MSNPNQQKHYIHIYKTTEMYTFDILAESEEKALETALFRVKRNQAIPVKSDNNLVAVIVRPEEKEK